MSCAARRAGLTAFAALALAAPARAQESVFGIRGLGLPGRPVSARSAAAAGAFDAFDPGAVSNPASLGRWRTMVGWAVGVPTRRTLEGGSGSGSEIVSLGATRFPLFGFATQPSRRLVVGMTIADYLNRTWGVRESVTVAPRGEPLAAIDVNTSVGGVSDIRFGAAYRVTERVDVGVGVHALSGSVRSVVVRDFYDTTYTDYSELSVIDYTGRGLSLGVTAQLLPQLVLAGTVRLNSRMTARESDGTRVRTRLPLETGVGVAVLPVPGVSLALSATRSTWSRAADDLAAAGLERSRDVWAVSLGGEFDTFRRGRDRVPLRLGYRARQLPFPVDGAPLDERAVAGGLSLDFAGGRTTLDLGLERGSRSAGDLRERFTSGFIGVIIRP